MTTQPDAPCEEAHTIAGLIMHLERQRRLVEELSALARSQRTLISERRADGLLEVLTQRQSVIDGVLALQTAVDSSVRSLGVHSKPSADERRRIEELLQAITGGLAEVIERDLIDQSSLQAGQSAVVTELSAIDAGRSARSAYDGSSRPAACGARFADATG